MKLFYFLTLFLFSFLISFAEKIPLVDIDADDPAIRYMGRTDRTNPKAVLFSWPGVSISAVFEGRVCNIKLKDLASEKDGNGDDYHNYYNVSIDGRAPFVLAGDASKEVYTIDTLKPGNHQITIFKRTESFVGGTVFYGLQLEQGKKLLPLKDDAKSLKIEFIGNSITCGYGNEGANKDCNFSADTENNYLAYGAITARNLNAEYMAIAFSGKGLYQNYDKTKDRTLPDMYDRIVPWNEKVKWDFKRWIPDVVVINLGTNDFAHANPDSTIWVNKYIEFLKRIRTNYPSAHILICEGPMMSDYWPEGTKALTTITKYLKAVENDSHKKGDGKVNLLMFPTQADNYGCDWHPGLKTHQKMAEQLTAFIKTIIK